MIRLVAALLVLTGSVNAQDAAPSQQDTSPSKPLIACLPENPNFPYYRRVSDTEQDFPGLYLELIDRISQTSGVELQVRRAPWTRCMSELRVGEVNMVFSASYLPEREALGCYPMLAPQQPDPSKRLIRHAYHLYIRQHDAERIEVRDQQIIGLTTPIAIRAGQSIAAVLAEREIAFSEMRSNSIVFRQLSIARVDAAAMIRNIGDAIIQDMPELVRLDPPIATRDYYLIMDHAGCQPGGLAEQLWAAMVTLRDGPWFEQRLQEYREQASWLNQDRDHSE